MSSTLNWGIIGAGAIAKAFVRGVGQSKNSKVVAIGSREQAKADAFGTEFNIPKRYGSYEALLADKDVQAVYIAVLHPMHARWAIAAANAKKHILCEKPMTLNAAEASAVFEAALANDVFLMEAFMYRCHPQTAKLVELIKEKAIGEVRIIQATFSFGSKVNPEGRLFKNDLAGGAILDVGCYPVSISRLIAGAAQGKDFANPTEVKGTGQLCQTGVDEYAIASLKFPGGIVAQLSTGVTLAQENVVRIFGTEGNILIPNPWVSNREGGTSSKIILNKKGVKEPQEFVFETPTTSYAYEADMVAANIDKRQAPSPAMSWDDTLGNIKTLDAWRESIGLTYDMEKPGKIGTVTGKPLAVAPKHNMKYGRMPGVDKPISRLIMGCDNQTAFPPAAVLYDDWFERGGNAFDTAYIYGGGKHERFLGDWIKTRGVREQVVVITKGAHTPWCFPDAITTQLNESLGRLSTNYVDIYIMHRDNTDVPVGEFIDVLNKHVKAGKIKTFGGSNWTIQRIEEANEYAKKKGLQGMSLLSNNFSLARMVDAPWKGCLAASDPESRAWLKKTQMPLFPWSSQARGFFLEGNAAPDKKTDKELVRCWYSEDNFKRLERANELAKKLGVRPINIALAYVLCQPYPTFALIGPRQLSETRTSLPALDVELSAEQVRWLNLEE